MEFEKKDEDHSPDMMNLPVPCDVRPSVRLPGPIDVLIVYALVFLYLVYGGYLFDSANNKWVSLLFSVGLGLIPFLYTKFVRLDSAAIFRHTVPDRRKILGGIALIFGVFLLVVLASTILEPFLPKESEMEVDIEAKVLDDSLLYSVLAIAVLPAIFEEILCRGFLLSGLVGSLSRTRAILLCGLLFALLHFEPVRIPFTFAAGIALSYAAVETGSFVLPMLMHFIYNFLLFALVRFGSAFPDEPLPDPAVAAPLSSSGDIVISVIVSLFFLGGALAFIRLGARMLVGKRRSAQA
jgi:membrane protease YdiL (CAAX protease family)